MFDSIKSFWPKQILWRLTFLNILTLTVLVILSSFTIYHAACGLVGGMGTDAYRQEQFSATLWQYLWIFSVSTIVLGSLIHFYLTKKLMRPLKTLIESTKVMKEGHYPETIQSRSKGEVAELIVHFNELMQQLKTNEQSRRKIVSDLSHEFRTPLSNLNGYMNALSNGVIAGNVELFKSLHGEAKRLTVMVEQLEKLKEWDFDAVQTYAETKPEEMGRLIRQTADMFHWQLQEQEIPVRIDAEPGNVRVCNGGIQQVLSNIIENAILYYEGDSPIQLIGRIEEAHYRVSIISEGQEIPETDSEKIFERFYRTDPSRNRETGGSGLGLAISKEIIERHKGEIGFDPSNNCYTFWFTVPLDKGV
ncbi:two-component system sensor histidine kinase BaeS [Chryseomicrobium aureum]|uniref:sensor histidine kinase n=1 Tax=Chryseomicrobium aureum TaxID=1441723 RepID=UPI0019573B61|nr:HAMP domain-containing sensor histidine kinase [Chryseomicrobium aureum]MBM7707635.1 two-component system sensor histidine kinase BaeS [Chryseomicrobium aureum]